MTTFEQFIATNRISMVASYTAFNPNMIEGAGREWIFETDDDITACESEEQACFWQRAYRRKLGFDPITGEYDDN